MCLCDGFKYIFIPPFFQGVRGSIAGSPTFHPHDHPMRKMYLFYLSKYVYLFPAVCVCVAQGNLQFIIKTAEFN